MTADDSAATDPAAVGPPVVNPTAADPSAVLITSELDKLPPEIVALLDVARPLPFGVTHFEKRYDADELLKTVAYAAVSTVAGLVCWLFGVMTFSQTNNGVTTFHFMPFVIGLVLLFAAFWILATLRTQWTLMRDQRAGRPTRRGIFLIDDRLVDHGPFGVTLLPRDAYRGQMGATVRYEHNGQPKTFDLPKALTNGTAEQVQAAVQQWGGGPVNNG